MRSRTIREGSVGLLILLGIGVFTGLLLWLRGLSPGQRSYDITIRFPNAEGMQVGAPVRYRGVVAGKISAIRVSPNYAEVDVRITPSTVVIPRDVTIEARQSGLVGETFINITPNQVLTQEATAANPLARDCNNELIVCNGAYLEGTASITLTELLASVIQFTDLFSSPEFFGEVRTLTRNFSNTAEDVGVLAGEVTTLSRSVRQELSTFSRSAAQSANSIGTAANQIGLTAGEVQGLLQDNRTTLISTLNSIDQTAQRIQLVVDNLAPMVEEGEFLQNLEILSANAAEASTNLRNLSQAVGTSENLLLLQQTLDSARATFQNAQKITADLDELTGDPAFRQNIRLLINGLSGLVSSTQQLQEQAQLAQMLTPATRTLEGQPAPWSAPASAASSPEQSPSPTAVTPATAELAAPSPDNSAAPKAATPESSAGAADLQLPNHGLRQAN
ncbi:MAG: MCE family protein [Synechococcales cyanobacterium C42_A2020_086]|jgi:phospholipid/cholesterol/gamma-HCH transport system substrate-binding protein|nr:MCE family protein [Synechococcales cyanobacterium C42_A2020_086]